MPGADGPAALHVELPDDAPGAGGSLSPRTVLALKAAAALLLVTAGVVLGVVLSNPPTRKEVAGVRVCRGAGHQAIPCETSAPVGGGGGDRPAVHKGCSDAGMELVHDPSSVFSDGGKLYLYGSGSSGRPLNSVVINLEDKSYGCRPEGVTPPPPAAWATAFQRWNPTGE